MYTAKYYNLCHHQLSSRHSFRPRQLEVKALQALDAQMQSRRPREDVDKAQFAQYDVDRSQIAAQYRSACVNCVCNLSLSDAVMLV